MAAYDAGRIKKHEFTRPVKEDDRVRQVDTLNAQTGPVFSHQLAVVDKVQDGQGHNRHHRGLERGHSDHSISSSPPWRSSLTKKRTSWTCSVSRRWRVTRRLFGAACGLLLFGLAYLAMEYLEGKTLPAVAMLEEAASK